MKKNKVRLIKRRMSKPLSVVQIEEFHNGYVITYPHPNADGNVSEVFQTDEGLSDSPTSNEDCKNARSLVYKIIEALGLCNYYFDIECRGKYEFTSKEEE